jgi:pre-mRNA-splicing factor ISY1
MARNAEKAQTMLNRFMEMRAQELGLKKEEERRPYLASECDDVVEAEKWRRQVIRDISKRVSQIQNPGLGEFRLRELNDDINKFLREKRHWEERIKQLGGPDYRRVGPRMFDHEGKEMPGGRGYKYFGAAKELPGVRELFEEAVHEMPKKTRGELYKEVDADYYGYRDDDDGILVELERQRERDLQEQGLDAWQTKRRADPKAYDVLHSLAEACKEAPERALTDYLHSLTLVPFKALVALPGPTDVEAFLVARRKQELLDRFLIK